MSLVLRTRHQPESWPESWPESRLRNRGQRWLPTPSSISFRHP